MAPIAHTTHASRAACGIAAAWLIVCTGLPAAAGDRWAVCYTSRPTPYELTQYDVVVLDADHHPPLAPLLDRDRTVLAYLSLTQIGAHRGVFPALTRAGVVLDAHAVWTDAHYLDIRRPEWTRAVLEDLVPRALEAGFTGLFLDTLDDADFLEQRDPLRHAGMKAAAVRLVLAIRQHYPQITLMVNRGYALVPQIAPAIDILLGESVLATFDPTTNVYARVPASDVAWQVNELRRAKASNAKLRVFTLDYWDPADTKGIKELYQRQRAQGFVPYVSTPLLDTIIGEPK